MRLKTLLLAAMVLAAGACAHAGSPRDAVQDVLANPARSAADRERDARERPADVLALAGFRRGMVIADVLGGAGYYSEILSGIVGPEGKVLLVNNPPYAAFARKDQDIRLAGNRLANVVASTAPTTALGLAPASLDGAVMVMAYHDLYWVDEKQGWPAVDAAQFLGQLASALKPGAALLVVDHRAGKGRGKDDASSLHRIEEAFAIADFRSHGLDWSGSIPVLDNPADPRTANVFDPAIRGKTDRFVHVYRKP